MQIIRFKSICKLWGALVYMVKTWRDERQVEDDDDDENDDVILALLSYCYVK